MLDVIDRLGLFALPNTAGCYTARDAVRTAQLAREAFETDWIKLEVIGDDRTLYPDAVELLDAAETAGRRRLHRPPLHQRRPDPRPPPRGGRLRRGDAARARRSAPAPASATPTTSRSSSSAPRCPVILDAGIGTASDAALAMELGCDARAARQRDLRAPRTRRRWPRAMRGAVEAGHAARRAGRIPRRTHAEASTADEGLPDLS